MRCHYRVRHGIADTVIRMMQETLMSAKKDLQVFDVPVVIEIVAYMKHPVYDSDDLCPKFYIDGLKRYRLKTVGGKKIRVEHPFWIIEDDTPSYVTAVASGVIKTKDDPRVEIHIKPYEEKM